MSMVSNAEFLSHLFPHLSTHYCAWVCSFPGDPGRAGRQQWAGFGLQTDNFSLTPSHPDFNSFTTFSAFRGRGEGETVLFPGRRGELFAGMYALMLDDLGDGPGAKLPLGEHLAKLAPSWMLETSPRNHQVGYLFTGPIEDRELATAFINAMIHEGLMADEDPGMAGVARYGRLPVGRNGKAKYGPEGFRHRLIVWEPARRYDPRQIAGAFNISWDRIENSRASTGKNMDVRGVDMPSAEKAWVDLLARAVGRFDTMPVDKGAGGVWYDCACPWMHEHTGGEDSGSAYAVGGGFECHHGHCRERTWQDVRQWLLDHEDSQIRDTAINLAGHEAFGSESQDAPTRETFGEPVSAFTRARAQISRLNKDSEPVAIDVAVLQLAEGMVQGHLTRIELGVLKQDIADATGIGKGELTRVLKPLIAARRAARNAEKNQRALMAKIGTHPNRKPVPIPAVLNFPICLGDSGAPALISDNIAFLLRQVGGEVAYNEMKQTKVFNAAFRGWSLDWVNSWLRDACILNGLPGANEINLKRITDKIAEEHSFHPFEQFLGRIQWDGVKRLQQVYGTIQVSPDKVRLRNLVLQKWLCSVVAAARHLYKDMIGLQPRGVLVLSGSQRKGKSTWIARLFRGLFEGSHECFIGGASFGNDKDSRIGAARGLVVEWGELDTTFRRSELGALKAYISQAVDSYRKPYAAEFTDAYRRTIFAGTVNDAEFLRDRTGNSRFWTIPILDIDLDSQRTIPFEQVWAEIDQMVLVETAKAEAADDYARPWLMSERQTEYLEAHNAGHRDRSDLEIWITELFQWDNSSWLDAGLDERLSINPMSITQIADIVGIRGRAGHHMSQLKSLLRDLTGQAEPIKTSRTIGGRQVHGRLWGMPPMAVTGIQENFQSLSKH